MAEKIEGAAYAAACLETMTRTLGIETSVTGSGEGKKIMLAVKTSAPGRLIGRNGRVLNNLNYLLNRILAGKSKEPALAQIDVEGGRAARGDEEEDSDPANRQAETPAPRPPRQPRDEVSGDDDERLRKLALDAAREVKRWGDPKTIGPFTTGERRIIHSTLKEDPTIRSESGEELPGRRKKITVFMAE